MMRVGGGMVYRHQKILQVKDVDPMPDTDSDCLEDELCESEDLQSRQFTAFNDPLIKELLD